MNYKFLRFPDFKKKALTLSYDDGMIYDKKLVEILNKYGLKCTFNLNSGELAPQADDTRRRLTRPEAIELYSGGIHEVAVHGLKHLQLDAVADEIAVNDVLEDRKNLERMFGKIIKGMAYAYGTFDDGAVDILRRCGIKYARTVISTEKFDIPSDWLRLPATCHHSNPRLGELTERFLCDEKPRNAWWNAPKLFYLWGHSYEFEDNGNWNVIENFAAKTGGRDDVWYATNGEIYDYIRAFDGLEYSVDGSAVYNPSCLGVWICLFGKDVYIPAGRTVSV